MRLEMDSLPSRVRIGTSFWGCLFTYGLWKALKIKFIERRTWSVTGGLRVVRPWRYRISDDLAEYLKVDPKLDERESFSHTQVIQASDTEEYPWWLDPIRTVVGFFSGLPFIGVDEESIPEWFGSVSLSHQSGNKIVLLGVRNPSKVVSTLRRYSNQVLNEERERRERQREADEFDRDVEVVAEGLERFSRRHGGHHPSSSRAGYGHGALRRRGRWRG
jgi:hypothetical protein